MISKSRVIDIIDEFLYNHTEDYIDWKYDKDIYHSEQKILDKLRKYLINEMDSDVDE